MKEQIWVPNIKYMWLSFNTSYAFEKTNVYEVRNTINEPRYEGIKWVQNPKGFVTVT